MWYWADDGYYSTMKETMPSRIMKDNALFFLIRKNYPCPSSIAKAVFFFFCQFNEVINLGFITCREKKKLVYSGVFKSG